ncbi:MAG TPA: heat-inducible transcriptional repressor HrcA [Gammaproteobacteria bacterium]|jgi:heat-inducible transcriptional repressor|nr:heat-inducible transcriptional repressor HrcA [Gammaproteobacteria bacterium]
MNDSGAEISERAQQMLRALIERFVVDGQPVGSRTLARDAGLKLSPATIRNVMSDLEELGFVASPHTSAGRVPTVQGYRFFVDTLLSVKPLDQRAIEKIRAEFDVEQAPKDLVESASGMVSAITQLAGIVTLPRRDHPLFKRVEFLPLSENRVLAVLVSGKDEVQNRILKTERACSAAELQQASNYLNKLFSGKDLDEVRATLLREMQQTRSDMNEMMMTAIRMADKVLEKNADEDFVMAGQTNLMGFHELCDVEKLRMLFDAFNEKRDILHLLDQCVHGEGIQIFIGEESGYKMLDECSMVTAPYTVDGRVLGVLGVIGPTRMAYERVIPIVDATARLLGAALNTKE